MSATPLSQLRISTTSPVTTARFTTTANFDVFYDRIEYGMGFNRGALEEFVESKGNTLQVAADVLEALEDGDWVLIPEEEHLGYIIGLWYNNAQCKELEERQKYSASQESPEVDGVIHYTYHLWHIPSLNMVGPDEQHLESGMSRVSSSIPPYLWAVYASIFAMDHSKDLPDMLFLSFTLLHSLVNDSSVPRAFLAVEPRQARPKCLCKEEKEERQAARNQRNWARVFARLTPGKNGELTDDQKRFQQQLIQHYMECDDRILLLR